MVMIGPTIATVRITEGLDKRTGKTNTMYSLIIPTTFVMEMKDKGQELEHLNQVRISMENTGIKKNPRKLAFKKKETTVTEEGVEKDEVTGNSE